MEEVEERPDEKINPWLAGAVILFLILLFILAGLIIRRAYFQKPVIRTAVERDLLRWLDQVKKNPGDTQAHISLADVYLQMDQRQKAIEELKMAIKLEPKLGRAYFGLGLVYLDQGKMEQAIEEFKMAAKLEPKNELAHYQLGRIYLQEKKYRQAIEVFKKTIEANPVLADAHYYLGLAYEKTGQKELAKREYQEALKYIPDYPEAKKALERLRDFDKPK